MASLDPTQRFSSRVENYVKYRPSYPGAVLDWLVAECCLTPQSLIADCGSGTGILSRLFLDYGCQVFGIEPNAAMRAAGERLLAGYPRFTSVAARAEATTLPDHSVHFVTAGQAFHWFDREAARDEFARILRPGGWVVLVWNDRPTDATHFLRGYEEVLHTYSREYRAVNHKDAAPEEQMDLFGHGLKLATFANSQSLDWESLVGRLLSSSYAPTAEDPDHAPMLVALRQLFDAHQVGGCISMDYETQVFCTQS